VTLALQQQRTALAAVLALRPALVILDEPTMGQDWRHLSRFMDYVVALNRQGCAVLLISHDYKLVHRYAERVVVLEEGRIVADGAPAGPRRAMDGEASDALHHA
jgi:energy-coupling factor transport system ATP-binding protein